MCLKRISFSDEAKSNLRAIPKRIAMNILTGIHRLAETGVGDIKKLEGIEPTEFRLRVGDYRVRFTEESGDILRIHAVKNRKEAYRK